jgi:FKBP-type peptidyl-prolyl cis-trans isomerase
MFPGFENVLFGMREGGVRKAIVPPEFGYGSKGFRDVPGNSFLLVEIDLRKIIDK